jgi:hypothetical protein
MIVFDLECQAAGHRFEGWFRSSDDFAAQRDGALLACPQCGSSAVDKAPMAPAVARKGNQLPAPASARPVVPGAGQAMSNRPGLPPEALAMMRKLAEMQAKALEKSRWVGESFADEARAMHYGEREAEPIHGEASLAEAREMLEEGLPVAPLPFPVVPPGEAH